MGNSAFGMGSEQEPALWGEIFCKNFLSAAHLRRSLRGRLCIASFLSNLCSLGFFLAGCKAKDSGMCSQKVAFNFPSCLNRQRLNWPMLPLPFYQYWCLLIAAGLTSSKLTLAMLCSLTLFLVMDILLVEYRTPGVICSVSALLPDLVPFKAFPGCYCCLLRLSLDFLYGLGGPCERVSSWSIRTLFLC